MEMFLEMHGRSCLYSMIGITRLIVKVNPIDYAPLAASFSEPLEACFDLKGLFC